MADTEIEIPGLGRRGDRIRPARGVDPSRLPLTPEEGFLLARVRGELTIDEVLRNSGLPEPKAVEILKNLVRKGALDGAGGRTDRTPGPADSASRFGGVVFNLLELREEGVELEELRRKEILFLHSRLGKVSHYELLGLNRNDPHTKVRESFLAMSKLYHPDRYFGRKLGSYQAKIEAIFKAGVEAERVLGDPAAKAAYDAKLPPTQDEIAAREQRAQDKDILDARAAERRQRLFKRSPLLRRMGTATEFAKRARIAFEKGEWVKAAADFSTAASLDPKDPQLAKMAAEAKSKADQEKADEVLSRAELAETSGNTEEAVAWYRRAAAIATRAPRVLKKVITKVLELEGGDASDARDLAQKLIELTPREAEAHALYGRALAASGNEKAARKAYERALELDSNQPVAKAALRKFRWPF